MTKYIKEVAMDMGQISADVSRENRTCIDIKFFNRFPFESDEHIFKRAHKWADKLIETCKKYEHD